MTNELVDHPGDPATRPQNWPGGTADGDRGRRRAAGRRPRRGRAGCHRRDPGAGGALEQRAVGSGGAGSRAAGGRLEPWPRRWSEWSYSGTRRCPGRSAGCWPARDVELVVVTPYPGLGGPRPVGHPGHLGRPVRGPGDSGLAEPGGSTGRRRPSDRGSTVCSRPGAGLPQRPGAGCRPVGGAWTPDEVVFVGSSSPVRDLDLAPVAT